MTHQEISVDLAVVGGGMAGVCAALAAARNGAKVALVQDRSVLGGNASSEVRMHIMGADCCGSRPGARESGIIEELRLEDAVRNPHRSYAQWDLLLYEKVMAEPNITLLLDTDFVGCRVAEDNGGRRIVAAEALRNSTEDRFTLHAPFFADCSGDGRLGAEAGADFVMGREARTDYGESLAVEVADRKKLGASILFTSRRHDAPQPFVAPPWVRRFRKGDFLHRPIHSWEYGVWWSEWGGHLDMIKDAPAIRHELLRIALGIWDYIKNSGEHPDASHWALDWVAPIIGKRESRRLLGPHVLVQQDLETGRVFPDQVAYGGWWIDLHPPAGIDAVQEEACLQVDLPHLYSLPLRSLYSRNVPNLFFAGRNLSASHVAFASPRVMATCALMGQAIGTAAALARAQPGEAIARIFGPAATARLQQQLLRDDAFLLGVRNDDPADFARHAHVTASSATSAGAACQVLDGVTRELSPALGPWADGGIHRWESAGLPAWIELAWGEPVALSEIHLTFDSGFQRGLFLSASDFFSAMTVRGPQPEIVRDYDIILDEKPVVAVNGNFLRKRIHRLPVPMACRTLRVCARATHGAPRAHLFEIRAY